MLKKMKNKIGILRMFIAVVILLFVFIFSSVCGLYYFERGAQPEMFGSMPAALSYIFITLTTIGYSDMYPITLGGKVICVVVSIIGSLIGLACLIGFIIGTLRFGTFLRKTGKKITKS